MDSLNKLTRDKLCCEIGLFINIFESQFNEMLDLSDIEHLCKQVYWNGYYKGANDGYDTGYLDGRKPEDYKEGW